MKNVIITRISGGLGNQLFQYAFGRQLAEKNDAELVLDASFYARPFLQDARRSFLLSKFRVQGREMNEADRRAIGIPDMASMTFFARAKRVLFRVTERLKPLYRRRLILEAGFSFDPELLKVVGPCYLSGVWQSEEYFKRIAPQIRSELVLLNAPSPLLSRWLEAVRASSSVAIHIRRGDYVQNAKTNAFHGVCSMEYYVSAMKHMEDVLGHPTFFVFSDDIGWAKEHLRTTHPIHFVSERGLEDQEELMVMSQCRHAIIANSSFSWWGAWLNPHLEKIVIAPKTWFNVAALDTETLLPPAWLRL